MCFKINNWKFYLINNSLIFLIFFSFNWFLVSYHCLEMMVGYNLIFLNLLRHFVWHKMIYSGECFICTWEECFLLFFHRIFYIYLLSVYSISSVQFSHSVISNSLQPHGLQHTRLSCPSPTPRACSNSCPSSQWCHPIISSSVIPFSSCLNLSQQQGLL